MGLKTILSTINGIDSKYLQNESIIEISPLHTVYKAKSNRIFFYALVATPDKDDESLKLQTLKSDSDDDVYQSLEQHHDNTEKGSSLKDELDNRVVNPNSIFVFLKTINQILIEYFGSPLTPVKIEANFDIMCNLMQELIEGGYPYITDSNTLKELVPFQDSFGSKFLSTTNQFAKSYANTSNSHSSLSSLNNLNENAVKIPWRKPNVKYTNNELFIDLKEDINVVLTHPRNITSSKKKSNTYKGYNKLVPTVAIIKGQIDFTSHLSGIPDIQLLLNLNGHSLGVPSFHRCIRTESWINRPGHLSFIPPDGKTTIMDYTIDLDQYPTSKIQRNVGLVNIDYKDGLGLKKNEFEITLTLNLFKNVSKVSNLKVRIKTHDDGNVKTLRLSHGDLQTKSSGNFEWTFDQHTNLGINPVLRGVVEPYDDSNDRYERSDEEDHSKSYSFPKSIALSYTNTAAIPSGIRVDSLKITRGLTEVKPYKGVKYITSTGDFVIR